MELDGTIGVIGNGAGLTMSTLDLIEFYNGRAANFLDVGGGGADQERVMHAVKLVASMPGGVNVIVVNLLGGGITRCDEVAKGGIIAAASRRRSSSGWPGRTRRKAGGCSPNAATGCSRAWMLP